MNRLLRTVAPAALAFAGVCALASAASAQTYSRLVVFGDSLSDNGNLFAASGGAQPPAAFYWQGRFSNGPVFAELLGFNLGRQTAGSPVTGSINYAYGGARTDTSAFPPGMRNQLLAYTGAGGTFGAGDLVSVWGGANNVFQGLAAFSLAPVGTNPQSFMQPIATSAASDINFIVNSVATAGAGTVLVMNLPKLSLTPQFNTSPAGALADFAATTFNGALFTQLSATAAARPGTNIILVDVFKAGDVIAQNPSAFGLTNATNACFNQSTLSVCANPNESFYFDGVHPTAAGHQIIADLATDYLYYGDAGAETALQGEAGHRHREEMLDLAGETFGGMAGWEAGTQLFFGALVDSTEYDARGVVPAAESEGSGFRGGLNWSPSPTWRVTLAGSFRQGAVMGAAQRFDIESYGIDAGLGWRSGAAFASLTAGASIDDYDSIERQTTLGPVVHTGDTSGGSAGARLQGGLWFGGGEGLSISPRVAVSWVSADVDGYYEEGVAAQYQYEDRTVQTLTAEATVRAEGDFGGMGFFIEGGWRDDLDDSSDPVGTSIAGSPSQVLYREVEGPFGGHMIANAGLEADFAGGRLALGYRGRFGDHADSHMGGISFSIPLP